MPPVARMTAVRLCFISASAPASDVAAMQPTATAGSPSLISASRMTRAVSLMHLAAEGCGERTMELRDLTAMRILKMAVEVGLVEGLMPGTQPRGLAVYT